MSYEDMIQESLKEMNEFCEFLLEKCDEYIEEKAKTENKTPNQVVKDIMKGYEGKTCGEIWDELKGDEK